jgi:hypothetical protein
VLILGVVGSAVVPVAVATAHPVRTAALPVPGSRPCREQEPQLLGAGAAPRRAIRLDLTKVASRKAGQTSLERVRAVTHLADGSLTPSTTSRKISAVLTTGRLGQGRVPVQASFRVSYPGAKPATSGNAFNLAGYFDALNGGALGLQPGTSTHPINDHLPSAPIGVGATWRVVNCDEIYTTPAMETRTYTLRSLAHGVLVASYRDVVALDPGNVDLGTTKVNGRSAKISLVALRGSATGSLRLPLANGLESSTMMVTTIHVALRAAATSRKPVVIHTDIVDSESEVPTR